MDSRKKAFYNKRNIKFEVIDMSQMQVVLDKLTEPHQENPKTIDVTAIRKKLAVTTVPGNSLIELYKEGK
jgi:hypothetical protein